MTEPTTDYRTVTDSTTESHGSTVSIASDAPKGIIRSYLLFSNGTLLVGWAKVVRTIFRGVRADKLRTVAYCMGYMTPSLHLALALSFLEVFNALAGITRSKPHLTLFFCSVRAIMEAVIAPRLSHCGTWPHLFTVACWSLGEVIRFGCFLLDLLVPGGTLAKTVRYNVGPIMFPLGALGELSIMLTYGYETEKWWIMIFAIILWPCGVYPLMRQLLRQRSKFLDRKRKQQQRQKRKDD